MVAAYSLEALCSKSCGSVQRQRRVESQVSPLMSGSANSLLAMQRKSPMAESCQRGTRRHSDKKPCRFNTESRWIRASRGASILQSSRHSCVSIEARSVSSVEGVIVWNLGYTVFADVLTSRSELPNLPEEARGPGCWAIGQLLDCISSGYLFGQRQGAEQIISSIQQILSFRTWTIRLWLPSNDR